MKKITLLGLMTLILVGCSKKPTIKSYSHSAPGYFVGEEFVFPMNTMSKYTVYSEEANNDFKDNFDSIIIENAKYFDRYHHYEGINNLYDLNKNNNLSNVNEQLYKCIKDAYDMTILTEGKFNLFVGEITDLFKDSLDNYDSSKMPLKEDIETIVNNIPKYNELDSVINFDNNTITINEYNGKKPIISVGGIGKGFIGDLLLDYLKDKDYPYLLDLGSSSISVKGNNPNKDDGKFTIGFRLPTLITGVVDVSCYISINGNYNLSTSGDYENCYFYEDNKKLMHHIINPLTGYSNNTYRSVSLISKDISLTVLDALSTAVFNCSNDEESIALIDTISSHYNGHIDYLLLKPYVLNDTIDFDKYTPLISDGFNSLISGELNSKIIKG